VQYRRRERIFLCAKIWSKISSPGHSPQKAITNRRDTISHRVSLRDTEFSKEIVDKDFAVAAFPPIAAVRRGHQVLDSIR
jgi:hypothetical protein